MGDDARVYRPADVSDIVGLTISEIDGAHRESEIITIKTTCGREFRMLHYQDCCEQVDVEDIVGDVSDLINTPILVAEERTSEGNEGEWGDTCTWTFYEFRTIKGSVTLRWYGSSNGYYSESVDFEERNPTSSEAG